MTSLVTYIVAYGQLNASKVNETSNHSKQLLCSMTRIIFNNDFYYVDIYNDGQLQCVTCARIIAVHQRAYELCMALKNLKHMTKYTLVNIRTVSRMVNDQIHSTFCGSVWFYHRKCCLRDVCIVLRCKCFMHSFGLNNTRRTFENSCVVLRS